MGSEDVLREALRQKQALIEDLERRLTEAELRAADAERRLALVETRQAMRRTA